MLYHKPSIFVFWSPYWQVGVEKDDGNAVKIKCKQILRDPALSIVLRMSDGVRLVADLVFQIQ
jgi:hypothetical protein